MKLPSGCLQCKGKLLKAPFAGNNFYCHDCNVIYMFTPTGILTGSYPMKRKNSLTDEGKEGK
jgi:hypothetical protein